jgi:CheY-like chemotaxis protein
MTSSEQAPARVPRIDARTMRDEGAQTGKRKVNEGSTAIALRDTVLAMEGKRILVAEDDDAIRQLVVDVLTDAGYAVTAARDGGEALARLTQADPDLVLLDQLMPGTDGTAFASAYARLRSSRAPIVALCASVDAPAWAAEIGAAAVITKPFDIDTLLATVAGQLGERANGA